MARVREGGGRWGAWRGERTEEREGWVTFAEDGGKEGALPGRGESKEKEAEEEVGVREGSGME